MATQIKRWIVAVLLVAAADAGEAQERGPLLLRLPASTRGLALGGVFPVGHTDSDALFHHAAFPTRLRGAGTAVHWWGGRATLYTMSAGMEWWNGGLAVGVRALDFGTGASASPDSLALPVSEADPFAEGMSVVSERAASAAYARRVRGVNAAITAHLVEQRVSGERNAFAAADVALGVERAPIAVGLAVRNIGPAYELAGRDVELPLRVEINAAGMQPLPVGPLDFVPVLSLRYDVDGDVAPAGGVELSYWPVPGRTFSLRLGARRADDGVRPFTAGLGFTGDRLLLDYALVPLHQRRLAHRFGVRWR